MVTTHKFFLKDDDDDDMDETLGEDDSLSLHSSSSFLIKDLVIEVLKKDIDNRNQDDIGKPNS